MIELTLLQAALTLMPFENEATDWLCVRHFNLQSGMVGEKHTARYFVQYNPLQYE